MITLKRTLTLCIGVFSRDVNRTWPPGSLSQAAAARRTILAISGTDFAVEPLRPAQPHVKFVGPLLPEPPLPLPPHLEAVIAGARSSAGRP